MGADPFFSLPRHTRPADWFERLLPALPLRLPPRSTPMWAVFHVHGAGGGVWSLRLDQGRIVSQPGAASPAGVHVSMTVAHFREAIGGAVRQRIAALLQRLGRPVALPDLSGLPLDVERLQAAAAVGGSVALVLRDRELDEGYRFVLLLGDAGAAASEADPPVLATVEADLDELVALLAARTPPLKLVSGGKLRVQGDVSLPLRALTVLVG